MWIYIYIYICTYIYVYVYVYVFIHKYIYYLCTNLPVDVIVRLPHARSGDSQGQETFLAPLFMYVYIYIYIYIPRNFMWLMKRF